MKSRNVNLGIFFSLFCTETKTLQLFATVFENHHKMSQLQKNPKNEWILISKHILVVNLGLFWTVERRYVKFRLVFVFAKITFSFKANWKFKRIWKLKMHSGQKKRPITNKKVTIDIVSLHLLWIFTTTMQLLNFSSKYFGFFSVVFWQKIQ